jgi:hypothetical protein
MYLPFSLLLVVVFNITNAGSLWINNASPPPKLARFAYQCPMYSQGTCYTYQAFSGSVGELVLCWDGFSFIVLVN